VRENGRRVIALDSLAAKNVRRMFQLYAYESHTIDGIVKRFAEDGIEYRPAISHWSRTWVHNMLTDRAYMEKSGIASSGIRANTNRSSTGTTWDRVQALLGNGQQLSHTMTYAGDLIQCGYCGHEITGELKVKQTKSGSREYVYYRCTKYNKPGHPRTRVTEMEFDRQILTLFDKMRIEDDKIRDWFRLVLASKTRDAQADSRVQRAELQRQESLIAAQKDRLLNLRIDGEIDESTLSQKQTALRDRSRQSNYNSRCWIARRMKMRI
jgi:site-specific DNA recombinase